MMMSPTLAAWLAVAQVTTTAHTPSTNIRLATMFAIHYMRLGTLRLYTKVPQSWPSTEAGSDVDPLPT